MEAIRILRKELDKYRTERDQFKLMAETIQLRYAAMKSSLYNPETNPYLDSFSATKLLNDLREKNLKLQTELEKTKGKLLEKEGDIEALRQEKRDLVMRLEEQSKLKGGSALEEEERQGFINQLEMQKQKIAQLKFDMQSMVDDKSDLFMEKEAYKAKAKRLQEEAAARSNMIQVDAILAENNQLKERMRGMEKDLEMSREIIIKYKVTYK